MLVTLLPLLLAPALQQDMFVQPVTNLSRSGQITESVRYTESFHCGWELAANGKRRAMRYDGQSALALGGFVAGGESVATGVDVSGRTVGWAEDQVGGAVVRRPFLYRDGFGMEQILLPQTSEGWAEAISVFGLEVVGTMRRPDGLLQAWEFEPDLPAVAVPLSTPAGWESEALAVEGEYIAGLVRDPQGREFAAVWDFHRVLTVLATPGAGDARATGLGIGGTHRLCGWFEDAQGQKQGFSLDLQDPQGSLVTLPTLGGDWCQPLDTDGFVVVGAAADANGAARAFEYSLSTQQIVDLNDRISLPSGAQLTEVASIAFGPHYGFNGAVGSRQFGATARQIKLNVTTALAGSPFTFSLTNGPELTTVVFVYGFSAGATPVPGCPGLHADIAQARVLAVGQTTQVGLCVESVQLPPQAAGLTALMQAVLPGECLTSVVATVPIN